MTVAELIAELQQYPPDSRVVVPHTVEPCCWHPPHVRIETPDEALEEYSVASCLLRDGHALPTVVIS